MGPRFTFIVSKAYVTLVEGLVVSVVLIPVVGKAEGRNPADFLALFEIQEQGIREEGIQYKLIVQGRFQGRVHDYRGSSRCRGRIVDLGNGCHRNARKSMDI